MRATFGTVGQNIMGDRKGTSLYGLGRRYSGGTLFPANLSLTHNLSKQAGKGMAAGRKKFLEFSIETDLGKKQKLKVEQGRPA